MLPARMDPSELADLWGLTKARVHQFVREGRLTKGADGKIDTREALAFRAAKLATHRGQILDQRYGNRFKAGDKAALSKTEQLTRERAFATDDPLALPDDDDDDPLALPEPETAPAAMVEQPSGMDEALRRSNELADLRAQKLRAELARVELRRQREQGEVVARVDVHKAAYSAGKLVASILRNLPSEIAALFTDPETKSEVRAKVQQRVDQVQHALYTAGKEAAAESDEDA